MSSFGGVYEGKRVLITGHTGFKGAWLSCWLNQLGARVCGFSDGIPTTPSLFEASGLASSIEHIVGDIRDTAHFEGVLTSFRPDFVFHLAAQAIVSTSYVDPLETISVNVLGTASVLQAMRQITWPCTVIVVTSDKCYENVEQPWGYREIDPLGGKDVYSSSKGAAEIITSSFQRSFFTNGHVRIATARAGNVIGGGDWAANRIVADCIRAWQAGSVVELRRPSSTRPWQHVLEPLSGYLRLAELLSAAASLNGEAFNFGPRAEQNRTVLELLKDLAGIWEPNQSGDLYRALPEPPFHEAGLLKLNCDKALLQLDWSPALSYKEAVQFTGSWYQRVVRDGASAATVTDEQIKQYEEFARTGGQPWACTT